MGTVATIPPMSHDPTQSGHEENVEQVGEKPTGILGFIERVGNALPDPAALFLLGALLVVVLSWVGTELDWSVEQTVYVPQFETVLDTGTGEPVERYETEVVGRVTKLVTDGEGDPVPATVESPLFDRVTKTVVEIDPETGEEVERKIDEAVLRRVQETRVVKPVSLLSREGFRWMFEHMVDNFTAFHPLGIVLVAMLGIGVAEKTGLMAALLKSLMLITPARLLTPATVFVGVLSSMAADAGYVILPPLAAALYKAVGRSPLVGLAAVFAGVSAGFSANLFPTSLDPLLAGLSEEGAQIIDPTYSVNVLCNYYFMIFSTVLLTLVGWAVTAFIIEPRFEGKPAELGGAAPLDADDEAATRIGLLEKKGLGWSAVSVLICLALTFAAILVPGAPFHTPPGEPAVWTAVIVPIMFILFLVPGIVYGIVTEQLEKETGTRKKDAGVAILMGRTMADMGPYIVLAFFAAQFIEFFNYTQLGTMLAIVGGNFLAAADLPAPVLMAMFIVIVMIGNLFIGSASAKFAIFAPVFIPMFMQIGISPELVQAAYRVGDSSSNIIAPLMPYLVVILVFMRRYVPSAGLGTIISLMVPYTVVFWLVWTVVLVVWMLLDIPLGPDGPVSIPPMG